MAPRGGPNLHPETRTKIRAVLSKRPVDEAIAEWRAADAEGRAALAEMLGFEPSERLLDDLIEPREGI